MGMSSALLRCNSCNDGEDARKLRDVVSNHLAAVFRARRGVRGVIARAMDDDVGNGRAAVFMIGCAMSASIARPLLWWLYMLCAECVHRAGAVVVVAVVGRAQRGAGWSVCTKHKRNVHLRL